MRFTVGAGEEAGVASGAAVELPLEQSVKPRIINTADKRLGGWNRFMRYGIRDFVLSRNALDMTDTELKLMASAAIMGESSQPVKG